ncbi:N-acetyltransferase [Chishuiella sp.]|uniref:GNAT family N-acetyltransferase n=1 Tax=Chishuiella sp. TaxID=1969467 RepID=UPI0028A97A37|nr:N-acetyltransferase [Chishuiella sp.]
MENIRQATKKDAKQIAEIMILAMDEIIYSFIGEENLDEGISFLEELIKQESNQYSYTNTIVVEIDQKIVGSCTFYDGNDLNKLRLPVLQLIKSRYNRTISPENETEQGEIYIDTIAISKASQGKGLGSKLLDYLVEEIGTKQHKTLGLLVDVRKPAAKKLYERKGFTVVGKKSLTAIEHEHMQRIPK